MCAILSYATCHVISVQISESANDEELQITAVDITNCLLECGITKPLAQLKTGDVPSHVRSIALHATVLKVKAALDQFVDGLKESCLLQNIREYPHLFRDLFVKSTDCLDSGMIQVKKVCKKV